MMYINTELTSKVKDINDSLNFLRSYLQTHPLLKQAWVFGSVAEGLEHDGSDIDLAFVCDNYYEFLDNSTEKGNWWSHLELGCRISLDYVVSEDTDDFRSLDNWEKAVKLYER